MSPATLPRLESRDKICEQPSSFQAQSHISSLWSQPHKFLLPCVLVGLYVAWLTKESESMELAALQIPDVNPVKSVWIHTPIAASVIYPLGIVLFGKRWMTDEKPFEIQHYVFVYNLYQVILNVWTVVEMIREVYTNPWYSVMHGFLPWGNRPQPGYAGYRITFLVWVHYNNKFVELLDTLWMVLKKKNKQITFLHCYHHMLLIWVWWHCCSLEPGGEAWFGACINSLIHVYMYGYYTLSLLKMPVNWMKIYMTSCQMLQFLICLIHAGTVAYLTTSTESHKNYIPIELTYDQAFVMVNMLFLFGHFFYKSYVVNSSKSKTKKVE